MKTQGSEVKAIAWERWKNSMISSIFSETKTLISVSRPITLKNDLKKIEIAWIFIILSEHTARMWLAMLMDTISAIFSKKKIRIQYVDRNCCSIFFGARHQSGYQVKLLRLRYLKDTWINSFLWIKLYWLPHTIVSLSLIHIWRCRRSTLCRSRWSPYH